jgi:hypothetical protein
MNMKGPPEACDDSSHASARARVSFREFYRVLDPSVALGSSSRERKQLASGSSSLIFFTHKNGSYPVADLDVGSCFFLRDIYRRRVMRSNSFFMKEKTRTQYILR